jgi:hypothetical protein
MLSVLMISTLFAGSSAQAAPVTSQGLSPASFLNSDGSLRLDGRFTGALDLAGWQVRLDPRRGPVFAPTATPSSGWNALGNGLNNWVGAIAISGSDVYVGGTFNNAGGNASADCIAKWDGLNWSALGSGLNGGVDAIAISGNDVYVGGGFDNAGGDTNADKIAKWDGTSWSALGDGVFGLGVYAIAISGSDVYVGGNFLDAGFANAENIAKWDGLNWSALGSGLNGGVHAIAISGSDVYVGGGFTDAGGNANADYIAKWDGSSWSALGSGFNNLVDAIAISGSNVYVGGSFTDAGGNTSADYIAKWNGSNWSALGSGLNYAVFAIAISGSNVYVGGGFTNVGGNANADHIAMWNGSNWSALGSGLNDYVEAITINGSDVYAGGLFTDAGGNANADHIAFYYTPSKRTFRSQAAYDGWVLESAETSGVGGTLNASAATFNLGDNAANKQYRAILSFDTSSLPDNAVISKITLKIKKQGLAGTDPFTTHGNLLVDIRKGAFGGNNALQLTDFQATASKSAAGTIKNTPVSGWYSVTFGSSAFTYVNKTGVTHFRLRFQKDDNDDNGADYLKFYSGNATTASNRPQLIVEYTTP